MRLPLCLALLTAAACGHDGALPAPSADLALPAPDLTAAAPDLARDRLCGEIGGACPDGWFCETPAGSCDLTPTPNGLCVVRPEICPGYVDPECGCDGSTYSNTCARQAARVSLAYAGVCGCLARCAPVLVCAQCKDGPRCVPRGTTCD